MTIAHWGGELETLARRAVIEPFEKDFNCTVTYDNAWPWFTKMSLAGPDNPPIDLYNGNLPEAMNLDVRRFLSAMTTSAPTARRSPICSKAWPFTGRA